MVIEKIYRGLYGLQIISMCLTITLIIIVNHVDHFQPKERQCQRMLKRIHIALISHASKAVLKILQARLQQYMNRELPDVQAGIRKAEEAEIKLPTSAGSWKKQESSRKASISALLTMPKPLTVWITINCGKF